MNQIDRQYKDSYRVSNKLKEAASKKLQKHLKIHMLKGAKFKHKFGGTFKKMDIKYKKFQYKYLAQFKLINSTLYFY